VCKMDSAGPRKNVTKFLSDSDHSTKVAPTTLSSFNSVIIVEVMQK